MQLSAPGLMASLCARLRRVPFVLMSTSSGALSEIADVNQSKFARVRIKLLCEASTAVAQTTSQAEELSTLLHRTRISVIPTPVLPVMPEPLLNNHFACYAGRFSREKDLTGLLLAWHSVLETVPDAHLTLVGEGGGFRSDEIDVRAAALSPETKNSVSMVGWADNPLPIICAADVFVLPSVSEGMSNVLLEACSVGRVVVATNIDANRAVLGDEYPLLYEPGDRTDCAQQLVRALTDRKLQGTVRANLQARMRRFQVDVVAEQLERALIDAGSPRR